MIPPSVNKISPKAPKSNLILWYPHNTCPTDKWFLKVQPSLLIHPIWVYRPDSMNIYKRHSMNIYVTIGRAHVNLKSDAIKERISIHLWTVSIKPGNNLSGDHFWVQCNVVSHWLNPHPGWSLPFYNLLPQPCQERAMMTSSNGNIFRVTGPLCWEFTGPRWIPRTKASDAELWCFLWSASE